MMTITVWINEVMKYELIMRVMGLNEEVLRFNSRCSSMQSRAKLSEALCSAARLASSKVGRASRQNVTRNFL